MEFVEIRHIISIKEYNENSVNDIVRMYSGKLKDTVFTDDAVIFIIIAPSTWRVCLIQPILEMYRYM